jgi:hypothetical protein
LRASGPAGTLDGVRHRPLPLALAAAVVVTALPAARPPAAGARHGRDGRDGRDEVRVAGACGGGLTSRLRVKADDGALEVELEVEHARRGSAWRLTLVQEGRVVWRGRARADGGRRVRAERRLRDLAGADRIRAHASGPGGLTCRAAATLPGG